MAGEIVVGKLGTPFIQNLSIPLSRWASTAYTMLESDFSLLGKTCISSYLLFFSCRIGSSRSLHASGKFHPSRYNADPDAGVQLVLNRFRLVIVVAIFLFIDRHDRPKFQGVSSDAVQPSIPVVPWLLLANTGCCIDCTRSPIT